MHRNNGTCYRQCQGRSVLLSPASAAMPFSSSLGWLGGTEGKGGLSHCLWVLSVTEKLAPCLPRQLCPPVALTLHPDSHTHCKVSRKLYLTTILSRVFFVKHIFLFFDFSELFCLCVRWSSSFPEQWGCTFRSQLNRSILWHHKGSTYHC